MKNPKHQYHIFFAGGLTAGPVMPLLALAKDWVKRDANVVPVFFDVYRSVAKSAVNNEGFKFHIVSAAKLRRYLSYHTLLMPIWFLISFIQSLIYTIIYRPKLVVGAGGFVQVPLMTVAAIFRIPYVIHQQDVLVTLSNQICAPLAKRITTVFESSVKSFPEGSGFGKDLGLHSKITCIGNPSRYKELPTRGKALEFFKLKHDWPTLLVIGGGSGAEAINQFIADNLNNLLKVTQIIHSTGKGKQTEKPQPGYYPYEFIERMDLAYAAADIVVSRAGIGAISELSQFSKASVIIPMPNTHQELNARMLKKHRAVVVINQSELNLESFLSMFKSLLHDAEHKKNLESRIHNLMPHTHKNGLLDICMEAKLS